MQLSTPRIAQDKSVLVCDSAAISDDDINLVADLNGWYVSRVRSVEQLVQTAAKESFDVLIMGLTENPEKALTVLAELIKVSPKTVRIVISGHVSPVVSARVAELAHSSLPMGAKEVQLSQAIEHALKVVSLIHKPALREEVGRIQKLPSLPEVYRELNDALVNGNANAKEIAAIIQKDAVMSAKVLQLVNSAFFGLERHIYRLNEAVTILGVRQIRDLALSYHLFETFPQTNQWSSFSFNEVQSRSLTVARFAQNICRAVKADRHIQGLAFLGGLLHDFGMVVLASNNPERYHDVMEKAQELNQPLYAVEKMELGVSHAEAGAYLLGIWNLPPKVIEAVLFHHFPASSNSSEFEPLTAVHIADALLPPVNSAIDCRLSSQLSMKYLDRLGLKGELNYLEMMAAEYCDRMETA
jgi:HD-like signal output (HDOD) protein